MINISFVFNISASPTLFMINVNAVIQKLYYEMGVLVKSN